MSCAKQETGFKKMIAEELPNALLGSCLDWIRDNLRPDEVFNQEQINKFVGNVALPTDVFSEEELQLWALNNGFLKDTKDNILTYG